MKNIYFIFIIIFFSSCKKKYFFQEFTSFNYTWKTKESVDFNVNISNNEEPYQLFIDVRHPNNYSYQNLWVFMTTKSSSNKYYKDTLNLNLAQPDGRWLGKSISGGLISHHILVKKDFTFIDTGSFTFSFEQAMRTEEIPVNDFGLIIQRGSLR